MDTSSSPNRKLHSWARYCASVILKPLVFHTYITQLEKKKNRHVFLGTTSARRICPNHWLISCLLSLTTAQIKLKLQVQSLPGETRSNSGAVVILERRTKQRTKQTSNHKHQIFKQSLQKVLLLFFHLNCVDDATGHDREFPSDRAHSQFELGHVRCGGQHVGETVWASCTHQEKKYNKINEKSHRRVVNTLIQNYTMRTDQNLIFSLKKRKVSHQLVFWDHQKGRLNLWRCSQKICPVWFWPHTEDIKLKS